MSEPARRIVSAAGNGVAADECCDQSAALRRRVAQLEAELDWLRRGWGVSNLREIDRMCDEAQGEIEAIRDRLAAHIGKLIAGPGAVPPPADPEDS